jgi:hypothetical protein
MSKAKKRYLEQCESVDLGFKVLPLFEVNVDKLIDWFNDLEKNYSDWKFVIGENHHIWEEPIVDPEGIIGHYLPDDAAYYTLCWNDDSPGPKPFEQGMAKPEYRDNDNDRLNPRKCFSGYVLDLINSLQFKSKKWVVTIHTPGTKLITHQDAPDKIRIHIPIITNNDSNWIIDGEEYHMTPGWAYLVNTTLPHSVENAGSTNRVHVYGKVWTEDVMNALRKGL